MRSRVKRVVWLFQVLVLLTVISCSKYDQRAPFFDGLVLEYKLGSIKTTYTVQLLGNKQLKRRFKIMETETGIIGDDIEEYYVDFHGKVNESSIPEYEGDYSPIWLPVHQMKIGDTFDESVVIKKDHWKRWEVLVIHRLSLGDALEYYYELDKGYLVGFKTRTMIGTHESVLVATNANIPVATP